MGCSVVKGSAPHTNWAQQLQQESGPHTRSTKIYNSQGGSLCSQNWSPKERRDKKTEFHSDGKRSPKWHPHAIQQRTGMPSCEWTGGWKGIQTTFKLPEMLNKDNSWICVWAPFHCVQNLYLTSGLHGCSSSITLTTLALPDVWSHQILEK